MLATFEKYLQLNYDKSQRRFEVKHFHTSVFSQLFLSMIENRELCLTLMGPNGAPQFMERIKHLMWPTLLEDWRRDFPQYSPEDLEFAYEFIFPGATNLVLQWLRNPKGLTTKEIARRLDRLGHYRHLAIREF